MDSLSSERVGNWQGLRIMECEKTGEKFDLQTYLQARLLCLKAVDEIICRVTDGMTEADGHALIKEVFAQKGITKFWHPSKFRIGLDTTRSFRDPSTPGLRTRTGELCFVDVGPVVNEHEADFGRTFVVGGGKPLDSKDGLLAEASERIFAQTAEAWKTQGLNGVELLRFAQNAAQQMGYQINPRMAGHRLGDFPHHVFSAQKLFEYERTPIENLWVLEIHIVDEACERGAFFEDILLGVGQGLGKPAV